MREVRKYLDNRQMRKRTWDFLFQIFTKYNQLGRTGQVPILSSYTWYLVSCGVVDFVVELSFLCT
jgi:hypothetical protein